MSLRFIGPLLCGGMLLLATGAFAGDPIPGVNVAGGKNPGGQLTAAYDRTCKNAGGVAERHPTRQGMWQCVTPASAGKAGKAAKANLPKTAVAPRAISDNNSPLPRDRKMIPGGFGGSGGSEQKKR
jgi:hypothetical protein